MMQNCFNNHDMDTQINAAAEIRRKNLAALVDAYGLAVISRKVGKPDRQIKDMIAGRKAFGEKVARAIEQAYDPDAPTGWLDVDRDGNREVREQVASYQSAPVTEPARDSISAADRDLLARYHSAAQETRSAIDLLLLKKTERDHLEPSVWATIIAIEAQSVAAARKFAVTQKRSAAA